jgi:hypothetical protein
MAGVVLSIGFLVVTGLMGVSAQQSVQTIIRDRGGSIIGEIRVRPDRILEARNRMGLVLGSYDPRSDETKDRRGSVLYKGNALSALIVCGSE